MDKSLVDYVSSVSFSGCDNAIPSPYSLSTQVSIKSVRHVSLNENNKKRTKTN